MNWKITLIVSAFILALAAGILVLIFSTEPKATQVTATKRTAMLVDVKPAEAGSFKPTIEAMGTVVAEKEVMLSPQVSGEIVFMSPAFAPGGFVEKGDLLVEIDRSDYETILLQRQSELHQAQADLELERGRRSVAEKDYALLGDEVVGENRSLVLREPQLNSAMARVESAEAAVRKAELDLERTQIRAPFNAHVLDRRANIGSLITRGEPLARIIGVDSYWIEVTVPVSKVNWITFPEAGEDGAEVIVSNRATWPKSAFRKGNIYRLIGALESQTRMARILVTVPDPLAREPENKDKPRLMVGSYMEVEIKGRQINDVVRLSRDYLRSNDTVWIKKDGKLEIRSPEIAFIDKDYAYISDGISAGESVVTSNLSTVVDGASLRLEGESE